MKGARSIEKIAEAALEDASPPDPDPELETLAEEAVAGNGGSGGGQAAAAAVTTERQSENQPVEVTCINISSKVTKYEL
jgi:hypothetical protein